eukprot:TRINITY_DN25100_c0_g1_i1.p1 TRINITY_DN25100_c0_g1~~TRINITY_DN25100_c0_g1_i1.p1  ORF type:complete len:214 (-),score=26.11 TRINITY_DN25100_c0_g1_i1:254-835(-)
MFAVRVIFRVLALSHLCCAVLLLSSKAKNRWGAHGDDSWSHGSGRAPIKVKLHDDRIQSLKGKLTMADRQAAVGFAVAAAFAFDFYSSDHYKDSLDRSQSHAARIAGMFFMWDGGLLLNYAFGGAAIWIGEDWDILTFQEQLLLHHALAAVALSALYLLWFGAKVAWTRQTPLTPRAVPIQSKQALQFVPNAP